MDYYRRMLCCVLIFASVLLRLSTEQKVEGEICTGENKPQFCEEIADCLTAEVNDGGRSPICSFYDELAPLCCRPIFEDVETFHNYSKSWQGENEKGVETAYNHTKSSQGEFSYESVSNISSKKSVSYFLAPTERTTASDQSTSVSTQRKTVPTKRTTVPAQTPTASIQRTTVSTQRTTVSTQRTTVPTTVITQTPTVSIQRTTVSTQRTTVPTTVPTQTPVGSILTDSTTVLTQRTTVPTTVPTQTPIGSILTDSTTVSTQRTTVPTTVPTQTPIGSILTDSTTVLTQRTTVPTTVPTQTPIGSILTDSTTVLTQRTTVPTTVPTQTPIGSTLTDSTTVLTQRTTLPPQTSPTSVPLTSKAKQKCEEYGKYVYVKDQFNPLLGDGKNKYVDRCAIYEQSLVLGGENARPHEFPHTARLVESVIPGEVKTILCGGSLISERFVVSTALCSAVPEKILNRTVNAVLLGGHNSTRYDDTIILKTIDRYYHPNFQWPKFNYDIVLYKLERDVKFGFTIRPICLETENYLPKRALLTGWGRIEHGGPFSEILQKIILSIVDLTKCRYKPIDTKRGYNQSDTKREVVEENTVLCAGDELGIGKDACNGFQGGPLQYQLKKPYCTYSLIGIYSGNPSGRCYPGIPGIYTRVSYYVPWIESIVWPE